LEAGQQKGKRKGRDEENVTSLEIIHQAKQETFFWSYVNEKTEFFRENYIQSANFIRDNLSKKIMGKLYITCNTKEQCAKMRKWFIETDIPVHGNTQATFLSEVRWGSSNSHPPRIETRYNAVFRTRRPEYLVRQHKLLIDIDAGIIDLQVPVDQCTFCYTTGHHSKQCPQIADFWRRFGQAYECPGCGMFDRHMSDFCVKTPKEDEARLAALGYLTAEYIEY